MDKLKKTIELIGSHQNVLNHYVVDPGVNLTTREMFDVLIKEIERLKKELESALIESCKYSDCSYREALKKKNG